MTDDSAIYLNNVSKVFKRYHRPADRLKEILLPGKQRAEEFWALQDINLEIQKGETVGILGRNGSGKSTLLQIIAGTLQPTTGTVQVHGRVSALLELGSGFNPEFTGRQNVFFNGRILGLSQEEIEERFDKISAFADIGEFIDQPVKTYSSGMFVRLAFAVAINVNPDVLVIDEALAVGDGVFVHRCIQKIRDFQSVGGTILFVSHDTGSIARLCSHAIWLDQSRMRDRGSPSDVTRCYQAWIYEEINAKNRTDKVIESTDQPEQKPDLSAHVKSPKPGTFKQNPYSNQHYVNFPKVERFGSGRAEIIAFHALKPGETEELVQVSPKDEILLVTKVLAHDHIEQPFVGVSLFDPIRTSISGVNTYQYKYDISSLSSGQILTVQFAIRWPEIYGGGYVLEPAVADGSQENHEMLDWIQCLYPIESSSDGITFGIFKFPSVRISHSLSHL
ncbi:MAG: ABC transporter ATP-binding protein [Cyanobacteria bacterium P01_D01_bin.56]